MNLRGGLTKLAVAATWLLSTRPVRFAWVLLSLVLFRVSWHGGNFPVGDLVGVCTLLWNADLGMVCHEARC